MTYLKFYTYSQIICSAVWMMLQVKVFEFQFKWAAMTGLQPPEAFGAVVVGHRVVGRCERAGGSGEIAPTTYRRESWNDAHPFFSGKMESSSSFQTDYCLSPLN